MNSQEQTEAKLLAYIEGELDDAGRMEIEQHLLAHPKHRRLLDELSAGRQLVRLLPRETAPVDLFENVQSQMERQVLLQPDPVSDPVEFGSVRINRWGQIWAIAASVILAVGLGLTIYNVMPNRSQPRAAVAVRSADRDGATPLSGGSTMPASPSAPGGASADTAGAPATAAHVTPAPGAELAGDGNLPPPASAVPDQADHVLPQSAMADARQPAARPSEARMAEAQPPEGRPVAKANVLSAGASAMRSAASGAGTPSPDAVVADAVGAAAPRPDQVAGGASAAGCSSDAVTPPAAAAAVARNTAPQPARDATLRSAKPRDAAGDASAPSMARRAPAPSARTATPVYLVLKTDADPEAARKKLQVLLDEQGLEAEASGSRLSPDVARTSGGSATRSVGSPPDGGSPEGASSEGAIVVRNVQRSQVAALLKGLNAPAGTTVASLYTTGPTAGASTPAVARVASARNAPGAARSKADRRSSTGPSTAASVAAPAPATQSTAAPASAADGGAPIQAGESLEIVNPIIKSKGKPITQALVVSKEGAVGISRIGLVEIVGLTPKQAAEKLTAAMRAKDPLAGNFEVRRPAVAKAAVASAETSNANAAAARAKLPPTVPASAVPIDVEALAASADRNSASDLYIVLQPPGPPAAAAP